MKLQEARSRYPAAHRRDYAAFIASLYTAPFVIVICLPTIVLIAARTHGVLGLILGVIVGIPASILISEIVSFVSWPLWEVFFWILGVLGKPTSMLNVATPFKVLHVCYNTSLNRILRMIFGGDGEDVAR